MSLPETSALLPAETKDDRPSPRRSSAESSEMPIAPDWVNSPMRPRTGAGAGVREALSPTSGAVLITPYAFGPISRIPYERTWRTSSRCRSSPAAPLSP